MDVDLPSFKHLEIGKTIGEGGYAIVKQGISRKSKNIVAVKFIHRKNAHRLGLSDEKIGVEVRIQKECSGHPNVVNLFSFGTDNVWVYLIMELAEGGDLFDKIEPDIGLDEELANFYFRQLVNSVDYIHSKGVVHRDIKPENIFLDGEGNLKLGDFGLASVYRYNDNERRQFKDKCGSPSYMAPEIFSEHSYDPVKSDIWSCGVVLFVLLTGQIAWQEPCYGHDYSYTNYVDSNGRLAYSPWNKFDGNVSSILRSIMQPNPSSRVSMSQIRLHPWVNSDNQFMNSEELCNDSQVLAEKLLSQLQVNFDDEDVDKIDDKNLPGISNNKQTYISMSQPVNNTANILNSSSRFEIPATQDHDVLNNLKMPSYDSNDKHERILDIISKDPTILQFKNNHGCSLSQISSTQRRLIEFKNVRLNAVKSLTRFFSVVPIESLLPILRDSLHRIGVTFSNIDHLDLENLSERETLRIEVNTVAEKSKLPLKGTINISLCDQSLPLKLVEFKRVRGDPLEWRSFFKKVAILSRDAVFIDQ